MLRKDKERKVYDQIKKNFSKLISLSLAPTVSWISSMIWAFSFLEGALFPVSIIFFFSALINLDQEVKLHNNLLIVCLIGVLMLLFELITTLSSKYLYEQTV